MAIITDPDNLNQSTEVTFNTSAKTITLAQAGNLSTDGVTLKALYSFCKEEWKTDSNLIKYPFPFTPITDEQFELRDGWDFANDASRYLIRTGGWAVVDTNGVTQEMWAGVITLGSLESGTQPYFAQSANTRVDFQLTGAVNQAVKIFTNGGTNDRSNLTIFARKQGDLFAQSSLSDIGVTEMTFQVYRFPLSTAPDLKIVRGDVGINTTPYTGIGISYYSSPITRTIGITTYQFNSEIDGNGQAIGDIYEYVQYLLRQNSDIDDGIGTVTGNTADNLLFFVGDTLKGKEGVFITNFAVGDNNSILHDPIGSSVDVAFPFIANLKLEFGTNLVNDSDAVFRVFFTNDDSGDNSGRDFGTSNAIIVNNFDGVGIATTVGGVTSATFTFDYDNNAQRGTSSKGTNAPITVVGLGLSTGQYVAANGIIERSTTNVVSLVSPLERNYLNP